MEFLRLGKLLVPTRKGSARGPPARSERKRTRCTSRSGPRERANTHQGDETPACATDAFGPIDRGFQLRDGDESPGRRGARTSPPNERATSLDSRYEASASTRR